MTLQSRDKTLDPELRIALSTETGVKSIHKFSSNLDTTDEPVIPIEEDTSVYDQLLLATMNEILCEIRKTNAYLAEMMNGEILGREIE